jgi:hypothetical protein
MTEHEWTREESGRVVRAVCLTHGWKGKWRSRSAYLLTQQLRSDEGGHVYAAVRNAEKESTR